MRVIEPGLSEEGRSGNAPGNQLTKGLWAAAVAVVVLSMSAGPALAQQGHDRALANILPNTMLPLQIDEVVVEDGQLVAVGSLGDETFGLPIDLELADRDIFDELGELPDLEQECPILDLQLGPISLDLLGLQVETSPICLEIWAEPNGLLGNLLCAIADGLLDPELSLGDILDALTEEELEGLRDLLNEILAEITSPASVVGVGGSGEEWDHPGRGGGPPPHAGRPDHAGPPNNNNNAGPSDPGATDILLLEVGPVFLDVLGLVVYLHDCDDGPVWVDIRALPGEGRLLGNLLTGLARLLDRDAAAPALAAKLRRIAEEIERLLELEQE